MVVIYYKLVEKEVKKEKNVNKFGGRVRFLDLVFFKNSVNSRTFLKICNFKSQTTILHLVIYEPVTKLVFQIVFKILVLDFNWI